MSELPEHADNLRPLDNPVQTDVVRWGQGPLCFEIQSSDPEIVSRAATIVASWPADRRARLARRWRVERAPTAGDEIVWEAYSSDPGDRSERLFRRSAPARLLQAVELDAVRQLIACPEAILGLHGALLSKSNAGRECGVALIGPCLAGKSTLACALWNSGWSFLCDDVTLFDDEGGAYPAPRRANIRHSSRALIGETLWGHAASTPSCDLTSSGVSFHPHEIDGRPRPDRTRLAAVIFLARRNAQVAPAELQRIDPVHAAIALLPYSNLLDRLSFSAALTRIAPVAERVPIYDMGRGPLPAMIARLDELAHHEEP
jgi:hypothetical protein